MEAIAFKGILPNGIYQFFDYGCKWYVNFYCEKGKLIPQNYNATLPQYSYIPQKFNHIVK